MSRNRPTPGESLAPESGGILQGLLLLLLIFVVIAVGAFLWKVRTETGAGTGSDRILQVQDELAGEEQEVRDEWQGRIDEARTELLVLQNENERLKEKAAAPSE